MRARPSAFERAYRGLLLIFPRAFRERFGREMLEFARQRMADSRRHGRAALRREAFRLFVDAAASAPRAWLLTSPHATREPPEAAFPLPLPPAYPRDNVDIFLSDLRFALRSLARRPGFTVVATLTLALGIGANTAVFSAVDASLLRPPPFEHPDRLVLVWGKQGDQPGQGVVYADYLEWRARNHTFSEMGAFRAQSVNLTGGETPERLVGSFVTASYLRTINARLARGRLFTDAETDVATKAPVAIVSSEAWQSKFGGDPAMLGEQITINGTTVTVVGIMVPGMPVPMWAATPPDVMLPVGYYPNAGAFERGQRGVAVLGRLAPGVPIDAAQRDLARVAKQLEQEYPATNAGTGADVIGLRDQLVVRVRDRLYVILAAVAVVLLIACANVANLQLARGAARTRELSVRAALGAGRGRIAQQLLTESAVLSLVGGAVGIAMAFGFIKVLVTTIGPSLPVDVSQLRLDTRVLAFAFAASLMTGLLFGVAPAWKASRADLDRMLRTRSGDGLDHRTTRNSLVVVQLALSVALLSSAGLIARSLMALEQIAPGFDAANMLTAQFRLSPTKYDSPEKIWSMFERAAAELRSLPGVESAALVRASPFSQNGDVSPVTIAGKPPLKPGDEPQMLVNSITPGYFATMRIPLLAGRDVGTGDRLGTPLVMLVNSSFAAKTWPGESALGKRVRIGTDDWRTVIGVVGDTKHFMLGETQFLQGYIPYAQVPQIFTSIVVRTRGNPLDLVKPVRAAIQRVDRDQPVWAFSTMARDVEGGIGSTQPMTWLLGIFSLIALLVAAVGTYGVLSYTMAQRTREIGIRIALGADSRSVARMVLGEGARLVGAAAAIGLLCALATAHWLRSQLYGVGPNDGVTFGVVTLVLVGVAMLACYLPARRASRVDPMTALRVD